MLGWDGQFRPNRSVHPASRFIGPEPQIVLYDGGVAVDFPDQRVPVFGVDVFLVGFLEYARIRHTWKMIRMSKIANEN